MDTSPGYAPIVLFCYNRPWHLQQTIGSLQQNTLALMSDLIIYSDGFKGESDKSAVDKVRELLKEITGFKSVTIFESERNQGLANSVIKGVSNTLQVYKKVIVLEDDLISTPDFLDFMNDALNAYEKRRDVYSVTGYCPPIEIPSNYGSDLFMVPRASSWGWGTWIDRWDKADWEVRDFNTFKNSRGLIKKFTEGGEDLWPMLYKQQKGVIDSWAIRWTYCQFRNQAFGVYPVKSKIKNIGTDGSGTNFHFKTDYYNAEVSLRSLAIEPNLKPDRAISYVFRGYYRLPFLLKMKNFLKYGI